jgi:hypothetical protein
MDPVDLTWSDLTTSDEGGDTLLSRWAAGSLDEAQERSVNLYLLSSSWAGDEARLHLAIHDGVREIAAARSPLIEGLKIAVRAAMGILEVLEESLRPLQPAGVLTRTGEFRRPTEHTFALDSLHPGARLHLQTRGGRFSVDVTRADDDHDNAEWVLAGPGGTLVASDEEGASFPSVAPGTWLLHRRNGSTSAPIQLRLNADE